MLANIIPIYYLLNLNGRILEKFIAPYKKQKPEPNRFGLRKETEMKLEVYLLIMSFSYSLVNGPETISMKYIPLDNFSTGILALYSPGFKVPE